MKSIHRTGSFWALTMCPAPSQAAHRVLVPAELRARLWCVSPSLPRPWRPEAQSPRARLAFKGVKPDTRHHQADAADSGLGVETCEE